MNSLTTLDRTPPLDHSATMAEKTSLKSRSRIFANEDLVAHSSSSSCWVSRNGKVYNVTSFLHDHPGGDDLILNHAGKDIGAVMKDASEHEHSESAYEMLESYVIGKLGTEAQIVDRGMCTLTVSLSYIT